MSATKDDVRRPGTAVYSKGHIKLAEILATARRVLIDEGYAGFSMRRVAARAGISLAALQHYFPTGHDLICGVSDHVLGSYTDALAKVLADVDDTPLARLAAVVDFYMRDMQSPETAVIFSELDYIARRDEAVAQSMSMMYRRYHDFIDHLIAAINPALEEEERRRRTAMILVLIDGVDLFQGPTFAPLRKPERFEPAIREEILKLAMEP